MLVILEGGDGSGKTTLCKTLVDCGAGKSDVYRNDNKAYDKYISYHITKDIIVCDRSFITDLVYRLNDDKEREHMDLYEISDILTMRPIVIVHCETDTSFEDGMKRGEDNITDKLLADKIKDTYRIVMKMISKFTDAFVIKYDWHIDNINEIIRFINSKSYYKKLKEV